MGVNGVTEAQSPAGANGTTDLNAKCCCGLLRIQIGAMLVAVFELAFFLYQIFATTMAYDKTGDEYALAFTLTLFSFVLAMVAVVLLLIGVHRRSPYFLVPHLLMQFAILCSTFLLAIYLILLIIGGTSVKLDAIFYEDSPRGELGLAQSSQLPPIRATIVAKGLNTILILLLFITTVSFAVQFWFFVVVRRCYQLYRQGILEKPSLNGTAASVVLNNSDRSSKLVP
ncbi:hypothetical protein Ddc_12822 [Ditylenchus destructor]|nr:hypothetical protein Ddc_12822 [Ditylenchus destructor]